MLHYSIESKPSHSAVMKIVVARQTKPTSQMVMYDDITHANIRSSQAAMIIHRYSWGM